MELISALLVQLMQMLLVLAAAPLLTGFVRKVKARLLRRRGPPVVQPYRDILRLLKKEVVVADNASWIFRVAPYAIFATTWVAAALVPTFAIGLLFSWSADLIAINLNRVEYAGALHDPLAAVIFCAPRGVDFSMINGRVVVKEGQLATIDLAPVIERHNTISARLVKRENM